MKKHSKLFLLFSTFSFLLSGCNLSLGIDFDHSNNTSESSSSSSSESSSPTDPETAIGSELNPLSMEDMDGHIATHGYSSDTYFYVKGIYNKAIGPNRGQGSFTGTISNENDSIYAYGNFEFPGSFALRISETLQNPVLVVKGIIGSDSFLPDGIRHEYRFISASVVGAEKTTRYREYNSGDSGSYISVSSAIYAMDSYHNKATDQEIYVEGKVVSSGAINSGVQYINMEISDVNNSIFLYRARCNDQTLLDRLSVLNGVRDCYVRVHGIAKYYYHGGTYEIDQGTIESISEFTINDLCFSENSHEILVGESFDIYKHLFINGRNDFDLRSEFIYTSNNENLIISEDGIASSDNVNVGDSITITVAHKTLPITASSTLHIVNEYSNMVWQYSELIYFYNQATLPNSDMHHFSCINSEISFDSQSNLSLKTNTWQYFSFQSGFFTISVQRGSIVEVEFYNYKYDTTYIVGQLYCMDSEWVQYGDMYRGRSQSVSFGKTGDYDVRLSIVRITYEI